MKPSITNVSDTKIRSTDAVLRMPKMSVVHCSVLKITVF